MNKKLKNYIFNNGFITQRVYKQINEKSNT